MSSEAVFQNGSPVAAVIGTERQRERKTPQPRTLPASEAPAASARFHVLHEIFEAQADARPDAVAVVFGREEATYAALEHRVNRIARHLRARVRLQHGRRARRSRQGTHRSNDQGEGRNGTTGTKGTR